MTVADAEGAARLGVALVFAENDSRLMRAAARLGARGAYTPRVARELPVDDVVKAHALAERGTGDGKITIVGF